MIDGIALRGLVDASLTVFCPCGSECVHLGPVRVHQDHRADVVTRHGVETATTPTSSGRGSTIEIMCWCEADHEFSIRLSFHKGTTTLTVSPPVHANVETPRVTLWRD